MQPVLAPGTPGGYNNKQGRTRIVCTGDFVKRVFSAALCVAFVFVTCLSLQVLLRQSVPSAVQYPKARYNLVIDPGHGGVDVGTVAADGTAEKEINLAIARDLYAFAVISGIPASMTRTGDYLVYKAGDDKNAQICITVLTILTAWITRCWFLFIKTILPIPPSGGCRFGTR